MISVLLPAVLSGYFRAVKVPAAGIAFLSLWVLDNVFAKTLYAIFIHLQAVCIYPAQLLYTGSVFWVTGLLPADTVFCPHHFHVVTVKSTIHDDMVVYTLNALTVLCVLVFCHQYVFKGFKSQFVSAVRYTAQVICHYLFCFFYCARQVLFTVCAGRVQVPYAEIAIA